MGKHVDLETKREALRRVADGETKVDVAEALDVSAAAIRGWQIAFEAGDLVFPEGEEGADEETESGGDEATSTATLLARIDALTDERDWLRLFCMRQFGRFVDEENPRLQK